MNSRPAEIGDCGVLVGQDRHGTISGLLIQIDKDTQAHLFGDWRMVGHIVEAVEGERIEVVVTDGSSYGAHGIRPLDDPAFA